MIEAAEEKEDKEMKKLLALIVVVSLLTGCSQNILTSKPKESQELPQDMHLPYALDASFDERIDSIVNDYIDANYFPSAVVLATKDGKIVFEKAYGDRMKYDMGSLVQNPDKVSTDTMYDLASCTKVMATTQSIMKLTYEGKIDVKEKVAKYIPSFAQNGKENVTVEELLTHTSGLPQWTPSFLYVDHNRQGELDYICQLPLIFEPGTVKYSDFGFQALGFIVEAVTGMGMDEYVEQEIYKPLGMTRTMYSPLDKGIAKNEIAATSWGNPYEYRMVDEVNNPGFGYDCTDDKEAFERFTGWRQHTLVGEVNDGNAAMANGGVAGHAGVFSTANDLAIIGQLMLNGGEYKGVRLYDQATIDLFTQNHTGSAERGYGFELDVSYMGDAATLNTFGHNGFTGTHVTFDKENNVQIIILTNKQNNGLNAKGSYPSTFTFGKNIANVFQEKLFN